MRWAKHLMLAHKDEAMAALLEEFGAEGYGTYWLILEDIGAPMETGKMEPNAIHSEVMWAQIAHLSVRRFRSILSFLNQVGLVVVSPSNDGRIESRTTVDHSPIGDRSEKKTSNDVNSTSNRIRIALPNILKYKDEYSKKSGQTPEQEQKQRESREKAEAEQKKPAALPPQNPTPIRPEIPSDTEQRIRKLANEAPDPQDFELGVQLAVQELVSSVHPEKTLAAMEENLPLWWVAMREGRAKSKTLRWIIPDRDYMRRPREPTAPKNPQINRNEARREALMRD